MDRVRLALFAFCGGLLLLLSARPAEAAERRDDASAACAADTSTSGTTAPPPGTTDPARSTDTDGTQGTPGSTDTSGIPGTTGLTPGTDGGAGDPITTFSPLRPSVADSSLPFTGTASDLLALMAAGLLAAGVLIVRAARPAAVATEGGEDR